MDVQIYLIIISFVAGFIFGRVFPRANGTTSRIFTEPNKRTNVEESKYPEIERLLQEVRRRGKLPINISAQVLGGLKTIAATPQWEQQIDKETIKNLYKIYNRWQFSLKPKNSKVIKFSGVGGFHERKYWEGTMAEYKEALEQGVITENTDIEIIEDDKDYHGSWIEFKDDGSIEEFME